MHLLIELLSIFLILQRKRNSCGNGGFGGYEVLPKNERREREKNRALFFSPSFLLLSMSEKGNNFAIETMAGSRTC